MNISRGKMKFAVPSVARLGEEEIFTLYFMLFTV